MTDAGSSQSRIERRAPRWLLVVLFTSLAVNLVIVGSVAGAVWRHRGPPGWRSVRG